MPAFVISPAPIPGACTHVVGPFEDRAAATPYATRSDTIVEHAVDVIWSGPLLVDIFNGVTGQHVKKFESFAVGVRRLLAALPEHAVPPTPGEIRDAVLTESLEQYLGVVADPTAQDPAEGAVFVEPVAKTDPVVLYNQLASTPVEQVAPPKRGRPSTKPLGEFRPVRPGSRLATIINHLAQGAHVDAIATACRPDFTRKDIVWWLGYLRQNNGVASSIADDGATTLILPPGKTLADCFKETK